MGWGRVVKRSRGSVLREREREREGERERGGEGRGRK